MLSHEMALAEQAKTWKFLELWVDPMLFPPAMVEAKLFFILFYFKVYPTFDLASILFDLD